MRAAIVYNAIKYLYNHHFFCKLYGITSNFKILPRRSDFSYFQFPMLYSTHPHKVFYQTSNFTCNTQERLTPTNESHLLQNIEQKDLGCLVISVFAGRTTAWKEKKTIIISNRSYMKERKYRNTRNILPQYKVWKIRIIQK